MAHGKHQNRDGVGDQRQTIVLRSADHHLRVVHVAVDAVVFQFCRNVLRKEVPVEIAKAPQNFVSLKGGVYVQRNQRDSRRDLQRVQAPVHIRAFELEAVVRQHPEGHVHAPEHQVVDTFPGVKGIALRPAVALIHLSPTVLTALVVEGDEQEAVDHTPEYRLQKIETAAQRQESQQQNVPINQHSKEVGNPQKFEVKDVNGILLVLALEKAINFIVQDLIPLLFFFSWFTDGLVRLGNVRVLDEDQENHLAHVSPDGHVQHRVTVGDHCGAVVEAVPHGVHRVREHLKDPVKNQLVAVQQEEEIAPIPSIFPQHTMGISLRPQCKRAHGQSRHVQEHIHETYGFWYNPMQICEHAPCDQVRPQNDVHHQSEHHPRIVFVWIVFNLVRVYVRVPYHDTFFDQLPGQFVLE
mmetsp:Transcript_23523/g.40616  ORF Transcript_23523/g.40616 Transcript_23523/m.40616 type:complete len:410 (+) Transcript_23523:440-1669(+)